MVILIRKQSEKQSICDYKINKVKGTFIEKPLENQDFKMASLPQGAFAACKIRSYKDKEMMVARMPSSTGKPNSTKHYQNEKLMEYSPAKYNSKLMTSIWGLYNRYSPHNIKGNDVSQTGPSYLQQSRTVASDSIAKQIANGIEWNFTLDK